MSYSLDAKSSAELQGVHTTSKRPGFKAEKAYGSVRSAWTQPTS